MNTHKTYTIGIQGDVGSTTERACKHFIQKHGMNPQNIKIKYLISSKNVIDNLLQKNIDFGTYAVFSSRAGIVKETEIALKNLSEEDQKKIQVVDKTTLQLDHALLYKNTIQTDEKVFIYSHPQALAEHKKYISEKYKTLDIEFIPEIDTALAAENLSKNKYKKNSLVIAPIICAELYPLSIFEKNLKSNNGYETTFHLISLVDKYIKR